MEASSKLKALKFMRRSAPATEPTKEEQKLAVQREKLAGDSRWRLDDSCFQPVSTSRFTVTHDYSPSSTSSQSSKNSRKAYNMPSYKDVEIEEDVDMDASKTKERTAMMKAVEKKHKDNIAQKSKQRHFSSATSIKK